jgi:penicillin-binding protein 2
MLNRAMQGFPPASTFKLITRSRRRWNRGVYGPNDQVPTSNSFCYDGQCYRDHGSPWQHVAFPMALAVSSNSFFYRAWG